MARFAWGFDFSQSFSYSTLRPSSESLSPHRPNSRIDGEQLPIPATQPLNYSNNSNNKPCVGKPKMIKGEREREILFRGAGGEGGDIGWMSRGWDGWMAPMKVDETQWNSMKVWASSGRLWRTGKLSVLQSMKSQSQIWLRDWMTTI